MAGPVIEDAAVCVSGDHITWCGRWADRPTESGASSDVIDLGEQVILPGLINAHCHLDYTRMVDQLLPPRSFTDWIKALVALKSSWTTEDYAASWSDGAQMLLRTGTTTVADIEAVPELLPAQWQSTPLRVISFRELIQLKKALAKDFLTQVGGSLAALPDSQSRLGLSPHAPYSTTSDLLEASADTARRHGWRLTTHVSESEEEFEMFMYRHGPMFEWLKNQRDMSDCGLGSPIQHLERYGYLDETLLAVHVNHLWRHDAGLLGRNKVSVVHCPRSHAYFRHLKFPREELQRAGVNICLGTDSLASTRREADEPVELDMLAEMRAFQKAAPQIDPGEILRMATVNAARGLGRERDLGQLSEGYLADLISVPFSGDPTDAAAAVIQHHGTVGASLIGGNWAIPPSR